MLKGKNMASEDYSCIFYTSTEDKTTNISSSTALSQAMLAEDFSAGIS